MKKFGRLCIVFCLICSLTTSTYAGWLTDIKDSVGSKVTEFTNKTKKFVDNELGTNFSKEDELVIEEQPEIELSEEDAALYADIQEFFDGIAGEGNITVGRDGSINTDNYVKNVMKDSILDAITGGIAGLFKGGKQVKKTVDAVKSVNKIAKELDKNAEKETVKSKQKETVKETTKEKQKEVVKETVKEKIEDSIYNHNPFEYIDNDIAIKLAKKHRNEISYFKTIGDDTPTHITLDEFIKLASNKSNKCATGTTEPPELEVNINNTKENVAIETVDENGNITITGVDTRQKAGPLEWLNYTPEDNNYRPESEAERAAEEANDHRGLAVKGTDISKWLDDAMSLTLEEVIDYEERYKADKANPISVCTICGQPKWSYIEEIHCGHDEKDYLHAMNFLDYLTPYTGSNGRMRFSIDYRKYKNYYEDKFLNDTVKSTPDTFCTECGYIWWGNLDKDTECNCHSDTNRVNYYGYEYRKELQHYTDANGIMRFTNTIK